MDQAKIYNGILLLFTIVFSLTVHEAAHAWVAKLRGDDTADKLGRLSLNPLVHIDPIGSVVLPFLMWILNAPMFGWAKAVPIDPRNFRNYRWDRLLVAFAGPASNILLAVIFAGIFHLTVRFAPAALADASAGATHFVGPFYDLLYYFVSTNLVLAFFNMLPIPPLDGSKVLASLLPRNVGDRFEAFQNQFSFVLIILLLATGVLRYLLIPVRYCMGLLLGNIG